MIGEWQVPLFGHRNRSMLKMNSMMFVFFHSRIAVAHQDLPNTSESNPGCSSGIS